MKNFDLNSIKSDVSKTDKDAKSSTSEIEYVEKQQLKALLDQDIATRILFNEMLKQDNEQRIKYADYIFTFTCLWCLSVFLFLILSGFQNSSFRMSDSVIITLITTTTINAFVFFKLVTKYLFRHNGAEFYAPIARNDLKK